MDKMVDESEISRGGVKARDITSTPISRQYDDEMMPLEQPLKTNDESMLEPRKGSRIKFKTTVMILPIPSHSEYSKKVKKVIWSDNAEIKLNAQRNLREFASEGWNWKNVLEEDEMFLDRLSNEWIHPVHLGGIMDLR